MTLFDATFAILTIAYPFIVYLSLGHLPPGILVLILLAVYGARFIAVRRRAANVGSPLAAWLFFALASFAVVVFATGSSATLLYYPVVVNAMLFAVFGYSVLHPPTVIERLARLREPNLPASGVAYTRRVTIAWLGFFVVNGAIAFATALAGDVSVWSLYNGLIAYVLMGVMFAVEFLLRQRIRRRVRA
jgi:uncharacterized membrane protein